MPVLSNEKGGRQVPRQRDADGEAGPPAGVPWWQLHTCERRSQKPVLSPHPQFTGAATLKPEKGGPKSPWQFWGQHGAWLWPCLHCAGHSETAHDHWSSSSSSAEDGAGDLGKALGFFKTRIS